MDQQQDALEPMAKRITVTLPNEIAEELEQWAKGEGRPTANLAAFLIQTAVEDRRKPTQQQKDQKQS